MVDHEAGPSRILVIEDSEADQSVYRRTLRGFDLEFANSGESGLDRLAEGRFVLVILDYHLPRMNGDDVLAGIRGGPDPEIPVVIVTGGGCENLAVEMLKKGASDYVTKDELHTPRVASAVRASLERHRLEMAHRRSEDELHRRQEELESTIRKLQEAQAHLIQSEKMASLGQLVAGVAHEINNPLAYVTNNMVAGLLSLYRDHLGSAVPAAIREVEQRVDIDYTLSNLDRLLGSTRQGLHRVGEIVDGLRDFSRLDESEFEVFDLNEAVRLTVEMVRYQIRQKEIQLVLELDRLPMVWCSPGQIHQVLLNLLMNAIQAVEPGSIITTRTRSLPGTGQVQLEVADDGPGIPESIRGKIFDPFFTTKPQGVGTGLGLWITYNIVEEHRGRIDLATEPGRGTTFTVTLPVTRPDGPS
jgi:two-component system NtrC family sensor kinase